MRNFAIWLLNVVGLLGLVGHVTGLYPLTFLFLHFQASPVPTVFGQANDRATFARRFSVSVDTATGRTVELGAAGTGYARLLDGPFSRRKGYVDRAGFVDLSAGHRTWSFLHYSFCRPGSLVDELGLERPIKAIRLRAWSALEEEDFEQSVTVECQFE